MQIKENRLSINKTLDIAWQKVQENICTHLQMSEFTRYLIITGWRDL